MVTFLDYSAYYGPVTDRTNYEPSPGLENRSPQPIKWQYKSHPSQQVHHMSHIPSTQEIKRAVGYKAAELITNDMVVGLGTGSTAFFFIERLIEQCRSEGLRITTVATSERSAQQAREGGLYVTDIDHVPYIDITVDGADEIDLHKHMIKGGGGALLREKIVASASYELVIIIDSTKQVDTLGAFPLPVEIVQFGHQTTLKHLRNEGLHGTLRLNPDHTPFITDENHYLVDIPILDTKTPLESIDRTIRNIPGVVETGFFFNMAGRVIIGYPDGRVEFLQ